MPKIPDESQLRAYVAHGRYGCPACGVQASVISRVLEDETGWSMTCKNCQLSWQEIEDLVGFRYEIADSAGNVGDFVPVPPPVDSETKTSS